MKKEIGLLRSAPRVELASRQGGYRNDAEVIAQADSIRQIRNEWYQIQVSAGEMKRHALQLGAVLIQVENDLQGPKTGRGNTGTGLRGWIEENLPDEIVAAYQSLMRWKQAAQSLMNQAQLDASEAVALLTDGDTRDVPTPSVKKFNEIMESKSLKQLVFDLSEAKKAPGRKPGMNAESYANLRKTPEQNAEFAWAKVIAPATVGAKSLAEMACVLPVERAAHAVAVLEPLVVALKARVKEG